VTRRAIAIVATAAALFVVASPAQADNPYPGLDHLFDFGSKGFGAGQLDDPAGIAVNHASGDVYVADRGNDRVSQFDADGDFIRAWGFDVVASGPDDSGTGFEVCDVVAHPADVCKAGAPSTEGGGFKNPTGIAVDNSSGPAAGSVYVQDTDNLRVQRFDSQGSFVLTWGEGVNGTSGGDVCPRPGFPGDLCGAGADSSAPTGFNGSGLGSWEYHGFSVERIAVDGAGRVYATSGDIERSSDVEDIHPGDQRLVRFDSSGAVLDYAHEMEPGKGILGQGVLALEHFLDVAVSGEGDAYVATDFHPLKFDAAQLSASGVVESRPSDFNALGSARRLAVDPGNGFLFVMSPTPASPCKVSDGNAQDHVVEYPPSGQVVDCSSPATPGMANLDQQIDSLAVSTSHRLYMVVGSEVRVFAAPAAEAPAVVSQSVDPLSRSALVKASVVANLVDTDVHVELGTAGPCSANPCEETDDQGVGASRAALEQQVQLNDLEPDTTYFYRVVATNSEGAAYGPDRLFHTLPAPVFDPSCPNNLARQQTGAAFLLDCRAYELVSAQNAGGYNVASDVLGSPAPFGGYPGAKDRALYAIQDGSVPGVSGNPTNRGPDPYLASRDGANQRWDSEYVGIPADAPEGPLASPAFSSTLLGSDQGLDTFAFGGPEICAPCFEDGTSGIPVRLPGGALVQGMAGPLDPGPADPAGTVRVPLSADGTHLVFGSTAKFAGGANNNGADATIYDRNLLTGQTQVASRLPTAAPIKNGANVAELGISTDGSRIVIGQRVAVDAAGNPYYHLYLHVGTAPATIDLTPGATHGVLYAGMSEDASMVYFTTEDALDTEAEQDSDESADLYRSDVDVETMSAALTRVSTGDAGGDTDSCDPAGNSFNPANWNVAPGGPTDCSAVAIGGGGGVAAASGVVYFLSPERLDGTGADGAPNLYRAAPDSDPQRVATLESSLSQALPAPTHGFERSFGDFENGEGVAIDSADGSTYVYDPGTAVLEPGPGATVKKFDATGKLDPGFGVGGTLDGSNSPGESLGALGDPDGSAFSAGVPTEVAVDNTCFAKHLSGSACTTFDPSNGDLYVSDLVTGGIKKFGPDGSFISEIAEAAIPGSTYVVGLAVNPANGNVYALRMTVKGELVRVRTFNNSTGAQVKPPTALSGATKPLGIAVDGTNRLYLADGASTKVYDATSFALISTLFSGPSMGVAVDPADNHVYVDTGGSVVEFNATGAQVGAPFGEADIGDSISLAASANRLVVSNRAAGNVAVFGPRIVQPDNAYDSPIAINALADSKSRRSADFQTTPDGAYAAFPTTLDLAGQGFDSAGHEEVYRYAHESGALECASCNPTLLEPASDATLPANGLGLAPDGSVFFDSAEALVLRDVNKVQDAYEWSGRPELISSGTDSSDSSLLSISADGTDAFFFTRETLVKGDDNGHHVKLYDARGNGGFFFVPPPPDCAASDECHGPGSQPPEETSLGTLSGSGGNANPTPPTTSPCAKGKVRRHGRCVSKHSRGKKRHRAKQGRHAHRGARR